MRIDDAHDESRSLLEAERNHLAEERTFLSWVRTGLAGVGGGVVMVRFLNFSSPTHQLIANFIGLGFILWGIGLFVFALIELEKASARLKTLFPRLQLPLKRTRIVVFFLLLLCSLLLFLLI